MNGHKLLKESGLLAKYKIDERVIPTRQQRRAVVRYLGLLDRQVEAEALQKKALKHLGRSYSETHWYKKLSWNLSFVAVLGLLQGQFAHADELLPPSVSSQLSEQTRHYIPAQAAADFTAGSQVQSVVQTKRSVQSLHLLANQHTEESYQQALASLDSDEFFVADNAILTVIDPALDQWEILSDAVKAGEVLLLKEGVSPLEQIIVKVKSMGQVKVLNILSHGADGEIYLAGQRIAANNLAEHEQQLKELGALLTEDGQLQLFGCDVAKSELGKGFVSELASLTGADVAGSVNVTGSGIEKTNQPSDWELEYFTGNQTIGIAQTFNSKRLLAYNNVLQTVYSFEEDGYCYVYPYYSVNTCPITVGSDLEIRAHSLDPFLSAAVYSNYTLNAQGTGAVHAGSANGQLWMSGGGWGSAGRPRYMEMQKTDNSDFSPNSVSVRFLTYRPSFTPPGQPVVDVFEIIGLDSSNTPVASIKYNDVYDGDSLAVNFINPASSVYTRNNGYFNTVPSRTISGSFASVRKLQFKINANFFGLDDLSLGAVGPVNNPPVNTVAPAISGTATVGNILVSNTGAWTDADGDTLTYSYQWYRADDNSGTNLAAIAGATAASRTLTSSDAHKYLRVVVTANDGNGGTQTATSAYTQITNSAPVNSTLPSISGTATVGNVLSTTNGTWSDADDDSRTYSYQWYRADDNSGTNLAAISGGTSASYTLTTSDAHKYLRVVITANDGRGGITAANSTYTQILNSAPVNSTPPDVSGTAVVGSTLSTSNGTWSDADGDSRTFNYQWYRADDSGGSSLVLIAGANSSSYMLTASDAQKYLRVVVTANDGYGGVQTAASAYTAAVNTLPSDITLSSSSVNQSVGANAVVGTLSSTDPDIGDTFTYTLVAGVGDTHNASFNISGLSLRANDSSALAAGSYNVRIRTTDNAGGSFEKAFALTVVDDVAPVLSGVAFDQNSVTVANQSAISLSLAGAEVGTKASYSITSNNGGTAVTASDLAVSSATQQFTGINVSGLNDGTLTVSLTLVDVAGNVSTAVTNTISKDAHVPQVSAITIGSGNYAEGDVISVSVTLDEEVTVSGTSSTLAIVIGGTTRQATFVSGNNGVLIYQYTVLANDNTDGMGVIALANGLALNGDTIRDAGGNNANLGYAQINNTAAQVDTLAPGAAVIVTPAAAVSVNADDYTISGTHSENGVTVNLYLDADNDGAPDNALVLDSAVVANGTWSLIAPLVADGVNNFVVIVEDAAGNASAPVDVPTITEDSTAPDAPFTPVLSAESDTGTSDSDGITSEATPILSGTAEPDSTVTLTSDKDGVVGTVAADSAGNWSITATTLVDGVHQLTVTATDAAGNISEASTALEVTIDTTAPVLSAIANQSLIAGTGSGALAVILSDEITDASSLTLTADSSDPAIIPLANLIVGGADANRSVTVTSVVPGVSVITLTSEDEAGNRGTTSFTVTVAAPNAAPVISGIPAASVNEGEPYSFTPTASDVDGDTLVFSIANKPTWAAFDTATGALTGTPVKADVGVTAGIVISVSDGELTATLPAFDLTVVAHNQAPVISGSPTTTIEPGNSYSFTPTATDPDGDALTFSISNKPAWATFNTSNGRLSGIPETSHTGTYSNIVISVSDGELTASLPAFSLTVAADDGDTGTPVITAPSSVTLNATALYTPVNLRQLLKLEADTDGAALQAALASLTTGGGEACCTTLPEGLNDNGVVLLAPGRHELVWTAVAAGGQSASASQVVSIRPLVSFAKNQHALRDSVAIVRILLNGVSPVYPLAIPVTIDTATTAAETEYTLLETVALFNEPGQTEAHIDVQLHAGANGGDSELVLGLDDRSSNPAVITGDLFDINSGAANRHTISLREGNIAPEVTLTLQQDERNTILVTRNGGDVLVTAQVTDLNPGDTHTYDWSGSDNVLADLDGNPANNTLLFSPAALDGRYYVQLKVTDSAGASETSDLYFRVVEQLPELDPNKDSNGNGIDDVTEGFGDANGNGIPDYLDAMPTDNVLPQQIIDTNTYLLECDPGVLCRIGRFALMGESGGVELLENDFEVVPDLTRDATHQPVGGIFDFEIKRLPVEGQTIRVVIPQRVTIPVDAVYRKYQNGAWKTFVENDRNQLHSAPGNPGFCPPPGDAQWEPGLIAGYLCVQLTLEDGGPNDADGLVNKAIADPGVVSVRTQTEPPVDPEPEPPVNPEPPVTPEPPKGKKSGGAIGGMETGLIVLLMILVLHRRRRTTSRLSA